MGNNKKSEYSKLDLKLECENMIRNSGVKVTKSRVAVMQCLAASTLSLSPREILETIEKDTTTRDVDQVSIYRILETFHKLGLVHQVYPSGGFIACTHVNCQEELHVLTRCLSCNKTNEIDIPKEIFQPVQWYLETHCGFMYRNTLFQLDGRCATCSQADHSEQTTNSPNPTHKS